MNTERNKVNQEVEIPNVNETMIVIHDGTTNGFQRMYIPNDGISIGLIQYVVSKMYQRLPSRQ